MALWVVFALLTAGVLSVLLRPLGRGEAATAAPSHALTHLTNHNAVRFRGAAVFAAMVLVPAIALGGYLWLGSPDLPDMPHGERLRQALVDHDLAALVQETERHLADHPDDERGFRVLAPAYERLGRFDEAAAAFARAVALSPPDADLLSCYGQALVYAAGGFVTKKARNVFGRVLALDPLEPRARYYKGVEAFQNADYGQALKEWSALLAESPADAPWRETVSKRIESVQNAVSPRP
ncbi:MAG: tetratricopeptide repeat protein [Hyphomicrobiales bacterium]